MLKDTSIIGERHTQKSKFLLRYSNKQKKNTKNQSPKFNFKTKTLKSRQLFLLLLKQANKLSCLI